ncbi:COPI alpha subunit C-terminus-domain-containing protein [Pisolithus microcarpus]|nr:COPI alpha subunit C-terminus-domain-containing protein [Pisolithus microcarpus]
MLILRVGVLSSALDDWAKEEESRNVIDPEGGWELDTNAAETEEQEDEFEDATELWVHNSSFATDNVAAGSFGTAIQLLNRQFGIINFVPLKALFLSTYKSSHVYLSFVTSMPPVQLHVRRSSSASSTSRVLPVAVRTLTTIHVELTEGFHLVSGNKLQDARAAFRSVLQALLLVIMSSDADTVEISAMTTDVPGIDSLLELSLDSPLQNLPHDGS